MAEECAAAVGDLFDVTIIGHLEILSIRAGRGGDPGKISIQL